MEYRVLGASGVRVSTLTLGTMVLGAWGNRDHDECVRIVHHALDAGINTIDTADVYANGQSEEIVGRALRGRRDDVVLATKFHNGMGDDVNMRGNSRRWITRAVEDSLRRLETDRIDLYQVHRPDPTTDLDETMSALSDLVHQGKVLALGTSTFPASHLVDAWWLAETRGHERFRSEQPPYSIFTRRIERDVLPTCLRLGMGVLVWSPLQGGWLTGKYRRGDAVPSDSRAATNGEHFDAGNEHKLTLVDELSVIAAEAGISLSHMALAFTLNHPAVTSAIIGVRTLEQLEQLLGASEVHLDADLLDRIDGLVPPGVTLNPRDDGWDPPSLAPASRRRA